MRRLVPLFPTTEKITVLPFGTLAVLCAGIVALLSFGVKLYFKRKTNLDTRRTIAKQDNQQNNLPRALRVASPMAVIFVVLLLGLTYWAIHRISITISGDVPDPALIWTFNAIFAMVVIQLLLAFSERQVIGFDKQSQTVAVLIPLYNEDPGVVRTMLTGLFHQSKLPNEIHVVDDGSTYEDYRGTSTWFKNEAAQRGVIVSWQRTKNQGKRHAQVQAFRQITTAELFITVDSDSILDREAIMQVCRPFYDARVQSVAGVILAINNKTNLLARITNLIFVSQQLTDRSSMSRLGSVMVNSGGLAAYRYETLSNNISAYLNESYLGRHVEFSDDSMLTLFSLLKGKAIQQPSAFAFAYMPDTWSHHYRQQVRWFRGSFIRGLWRAHFTAVGSWVFWRQTIGWVQLALISMVFVYIFLWRPIFDGVGVPIEAIIIPLLVSYAQNARYIGIWRADESTLDRYLTVLLLSPLTTLWIMLILRPLRIWGALSSRKMGWNTRSNIEVSSL